MYLLDFSQNRHIMNSMNNMNNTNNTGITPTLKMFDALAQRKYVKFNTLVAFEPNPPSEKAMQMLGNCAKAIQKLMETESAKLEIQQVIDALNEISNETK